MTWESVILIALGVVGIVGAIGAVADFIVPRKEGD